MWGIPEGRGYKLWNTVGFFKLGLQFPFIILNLDKYSTFFTKYYTEKSWKFDG